MRVGLLHVSHKRNTSREQIRRQDYGPFTEEEELVKNERSNSCINENYTLESWKEELHNEFSRWRFEPKLCLKSKDVSSSTVPTTSSTLRRTMLQVQYRSSSNNYDNNTWGCRIVTMIAKLHEMVSFYLLAELRHREQADQGALPRMSQEVEELKNAR